MAKRLLLVMDEVKCGGAEISFFTLARALAARCEVHFALSLASLEHPTLRRLSNSLSNTPVTVHLCSAALNPGTLTNIHRGLRAKSARELASLVRRVRPEMILVNLPTLERGQSVVDAADLVAPRPPVWGFVHSANRPSVIGAKLGQLRDPLVPRLVRRFDRLLAVSTAGAEEISNRYHLRRPDVLHPPITLPQPCTSSDQRSARRKAEGLSDTFLLGIVGRVQIHKGQDVALRVTARLLKAGLQLHLLVIGDGPNAAAVSQLAQQLRITSHVSFLGWRDDADELIPLLDALIMPSKHEGMPLTALQAASARVPVAGYSVDGLAELLPDGFKIPHGDEQALTATVAGLICGAKTWPADEIARRSEEWSSPENVARELLRLVNAAESSP